MNDLATRASLLSPIAPSKKQSVVRWDNLAGAARAIATANVIARRPHLNVIVAESSTSAQQWYHELRCQLPKNQNIWLFPEWETLPYDIFSPHQDIISQRIRTLFNIQKDRSGVLIISAPALMLRIPPAEYIDATTFIVNVGDLLNIDKLRTRLEKCGYRCVSEVYEHGEFAVRGAIVDVYPMGAKTPFRIDLFDDEVETIRTFEPDSQRSLDKIEQIEVLPAREFPMTESSISCFRQNYLDRFAGDPQRSLIYREVSKGVAVSGIEYYLPMFFEKTATLFDYLPEHTLFFGTANITAEAEKFWEQIEHRYDQRRHDPERPLLPPSEIYLKPADLQSEFGNYRSVIFAKDSSAIDYQCIPGTSFAATTGENSLDKLAKYILQTESRCLLYADSVGRQDYLINELKKRDCELVQSKGFAEFSEGKAKFAITVGSIEAGCQITPANIEIITEGQLFGQKALQRRRRKAQQRPTESLIKNLNDLSIGSPVVHEDHGVGRYQGLQRLSVSGIENEFLVITYAGTDKLYVPVSNLDAISRYTGISEENAPLHKLGKDQWTKAKQKAAEKVRDAAAELLAIYAKREAQLGEPCSVNEDELQKFADEFPFEETPDQDNAIDAVQADLLEAKPMDRVICGDVGFGKTEVAMRAAFIAVQAGFQVAVLVPTTLLAQQHHQNFVDRFAGWPVQIDSLSRFKSPKEQKEILERVASGKVDIVIGTHKLVQPDVKYKNLGLVIIDEEHRFGVRHKDQMKAIRAQVNVLTMTATPIPRTLNLAMSNLRDLSIIATPPAKRLAVKTFVMEWNASTIEEAILREIKRGGQVYVLHNDVSTIEKTVSQIADMVPEAKVRFGHGQMRERELEAVMLDFYHQRFNVLVATTIIESGIDVPTANTIIINRADKFGIAQLHQLRGRVGRSHHQAYCYMVTPHKKAMTSDAVKRLEAIEATGELGSGFMLATHDLEIRGAGELLGDDQSGQMQEIGFTLYTELLERAVKSIQAGEDMNVLDYEDKSAVEVDLNIPAIIPDDYLPDVHTRLILYKRIASVKTEAELKDLKVEMIDRFGLLPDQVKNLFEYADIKIRARKLGATKVEGDKRSIRVSFNDNPNFNPEVAINMIRNDPAIYRLDGPSRFKAEKDTHTAELRLKLTNTIINELSA